MLPTVVTYCRLLLRPSTVTLDWRFENIENQQIVFIVLVIFHIYGLRKAHAVKTSTPSNLPLNPSIQPPHRLEISPLLRKSLLRNTQISPNSKPMLRITKQRSLISLIPLEENLLDRRPVLRRVTLVQIPKSNTDGRHDRFPFLGLRVRGVRGEAGVDAFALGQVAGDVFAAETVAYGADFGGVVGCADGGEGGVDYGFDLVHWVAFLPVGEAVV